MGNEKLLSVFEASLWAAFNSQHVLWSVNQCGGYYKERNTQRPLAYVDRRLILPTFSSSNAVRWCMLHTFPQVKDKHSVRHMNVLIIQKNRKNKSLWWRKGQINLHRMKHIYSISTYIYMSWEAEWKYTEIKVRKVDMSQWCPGR